MIGTTGIMLGIPLCCQHRPGACTRREQGVPFFVRAPQRYTSSSTVVGELVVVEVGLVPDSDLAERVELPGAPSLSGESDLLSMISGGGGGRRARPAT
ncbi:MAG: hypothetical protein ACRD9S_07765 [Pyrinomonadaceae bacterium]